MEGYTVTLIGVVAFLATLLLGWKPIKNFFASAGWKKADSIMEFIDLLRKSIADGKITEQEIEDLEKQIKVIKEEFSKAEE